MLTLLVTCCPCLTALLGGPARQWACASTLKRKLALTLALAHARLKARLEARLTRIGSRIASRRHNGL